MPRPDARAGHPLQPDSEKPPRPDLGGGLQGGRQHDLCRETPGNPIQRSHRSLTPGRGSQGGRPPAPKQLARWCRGTPPTRFREATRDLSPGGRSQGGRPPAVIRGTPPTRFREATRDLPPGRGFQGVVPPQVIASPRRYHEKVPREPWPKPQPSRDSRPFGVGPGTQLRSEVCRGPKPAAVCDPKIASSRLREDFAGG